MRIHEVRTELLKIAGDLEYAGIKDAAECIRNLVDEMHRRPYVRKTGPRRKRPPTEAVRLYAHQHPDADYMEIAAHFQTNTGRISEALAGFRE
jgi:hypothetical protein